MKDLSPIMKSALKVIDTIREQIVNGDCDEESVAKSMTKLHPASDKDYINPKDYCNGEKAMEMLHLGYNTARFHQLLKKYKVKNHKVNNQPIGYKIKDIERIKKEILV